MKVGVDFITKKVDHLAPVLPPIPFERPAKSEYRKDEFLTLKLRNQPNDPNSTTYDLTIKYFQNGIQKNGSSSRDQ